MNAVMEGRHLVYVDEVGFMVSSRVNRGRAERGESARVETTIIRFAFTSLDTLRIIR